jgi:phage RecT family recombinase
MRNYDAWKTRSPDDERWFEDDDRPTDEDDEMTDTAVATVNKLPIVILRERLEARHFELKNALPSDITPEQFIRAVTTAATINPEIQACTWQSVWEACMRACRDGLLPDGVDGAIVPYKSKAGWIPMYQGLLRRFRRSGKFKWVTANVVRVGEEFEHYIDEFGEHFRHVPGDNFDAAIVKIYALATTKDGGVFVTAMSIAEANKIRNMSRTTRDDSPWKQWPEEMYKKTALRRLCKVLPSGRDILPDEDIPEVEAPPTAPAVARAPGAAAALEQFASVSSTGSAHDTQTVGESDGEQGGSTAVPDPVAVDDHTEHLKLVEAFKHGQQAKADGQRRAVPPEYRDEPNATRFALCWQAGFDGESMPEFGD